MATLRDLTVNIYVQGNAEQKLGEVDKKTKGLIGTFKEFFRGAADIKAGFDLIAQAANGLVGIITSSIESTGALGDQADALNTTIEAMQTYQGVGAKLGISNKGIEKSLVKVTQALTAAGDAGSTQAKAFKTLGIETLDSNGEMRSTIDVMRDLAQAYQNDPAKNQPILQKLIGKSFSENQGILKLSAEEYDKLSAAVVENGIITQAHDKAAEKVELSYAALSKQIDVLKANLVIALGPAISFVIERVQYLVKWVGKWFDTLNGDKSIEDWAWQIEEYAIQAWNAFVVYFANPLIDTFNVLKATWKQFSKAIEESGVIVAAVLGGITGVITKMAITAIPKLIAATYAQTAALWAQAAAWAAAYAIPILIGAAVVALAYLIYENWDEIKNMSLQVWQAIKDGWDAATDGIASGIGWVVDTFTSAWDSIKTFFNDTVKYISDTWDSVWAPIAAGIDAVSGLFGGGDVNVNNETQGTLPASSVVQSSVNNSETTNNNTEVGQIVVQTQAQDAQQVAKEVQKLVRPGNNQLAQASYRRNR